MKDENLLETNTGGTSKVYVGKSEARPKKTRILEDEDEERVDEEEHEERVERVGFRIICQRACRAHEKERAEEILICVIVPV